MFVLLAYEEVKISYFRELLDDILWDKVDVVVLACLNAVVAQQWVDSQ